MPLALQYLQQWRIPSRDCGCRRQPDFPLLCLPPASRLAARRCLCERSSRPRSCGFPLFPPGFQLLSVAAEGLFLSFFLSPLEQATCKHGCIYTEYRAQLSVSGVGILALKIDHKNPKSRNSYYLVLRKVTHVSSRAEAPEGFQAPCFSSFLPPFLPFLS